MTKIYKTVTYCALALYRKRKNGSYQYEWMDLRSYGTKKEAEDYVKRESKISYRDGRTGRYMIQKRTNEGVYVDGKIEK